MSLARVLAILAALLLAAPPAAAQTSSGGAPALPLTQGEGGGSLAPMWPDATPPADAAGLDEETAAGEPAQNGQTPTTPEGEPQPNGGDEPVDDDNGVDEDTSGGLLPGEGERAPQDDGAGAPESVQDLPSTGLEIAALAAIGLGLLMGGVAIRPRQQAR